MWTYHGVRRKGGKAKWEVMEEGTKQWRDTKFLLTSHTAMSQQDWIWITWTHPLKKINNHVHKNTDILHTFINSLVQHMRVFMNVRVCAARQASLSLHPGCGFAWGSHRGVFINEKPPAPTPLVFSLPAATTTKCLPNTQILCLLTPLPPSLPFCAKLWWQPVWHHQSPGRCHVTTATAAVQLHCGFVLVVNRPVSLIL